MKKIIENRFFEYFIIWLIFANGITMWLETSKEITDSYWSYLRGFNTFVIGVFALEAVMKISTYGKKYFKSWWNVFDFLIVVISLIPSSWPLEILRTLRVFRLLRLITLVPSMRKVVIALFSVIPWILSVSALLVLIFYIYAIITTSLFQERFPEWFWDIWNSFYTLFQIMTLESWSMWIARPVMEAFPYSWVIFVSFVLIATFVMFNLIIAIVVEAMNKINKEDEEAILDRLQESENATKNDIKALESKVDNLTKILEKHLNKNR